VGGGGRGGVWYAQCGVGGAPAPGRSEERLTRSASGDSGAAACHAAMKPQWCKSENAGQAQAGLWGLLPRSELRAARQRMSQTANARRVVNVVVARRHQRTISVR